MTYGEISQRLKLTDHNLYWAYKKASDVLTFELLNNVIFAETNDRVWSIKWDIFEAVRDVEDQIIDCDTV